MAQKKQLSGADRVTPLHDRVLIEPFEEDQLQSGNDAGIIMPETAQEEKPQQGKIVAVGDGKRDENGELIPMSVEVGQKVIFSKFGYDTITVDSEEYYILKEDNILAVIS